MRDFDDSTLWRISAYERFRAEAGHSGFGSLGAPTVLPTTLTAELLALQQQRRSTDALEVVAACLRQRENALVILRHHELVWPMTLFPRDNLYHLPRPLLESLADGNRDLEVLSVEPPGLRPPAQFMHERDAAQRGWHLLPPLLWALSLHAPRAHLLDDIAGRVAYRVASDFSARGTELAGALRPALQRLRSEIAPLYQIARWPGMDSERAARLLNGVYLQGGLIVLRTHRSARDDKTSEHRLLRWLRPRR